eukprot:642330-Hanusia_phi.AAC.1
MPGSGSELEHERRGEVHLSPHPEEVLCTLGFHNDPENVVAGDPFKIVVQAKGLVPNSRYRMHVSIKLKYDQHYVYHEDSVLQGSEGGVEVVIFDVPSAWPRSMVIVSHLYDYYTGEENENSLLAYLSRGLDIMVPCM